jgi:tetrahydromethanopterin S-methyltransferase subunit B
VRTKPAPTAAGYSGTPLAAKLGISPGATVALIDAPPGVITDLPPGVVLKSRAAGSADVVVVFVTQAAKLEQRIAALEKMIFPSGSLWAAWPKRTSGVETDVTDHVVRETALPRGLVDNKVCAIDAIWTGLRLVWRVDLRS